MEFWAPQQADWRSGGKLERSAVTAEVHSLASYRTSASREDRIARANAVYWRLVGRILCVSSAALVALALAMMVRVMGV
jgi:hypothetical protein